MTGIGDLSELDRLAFRLFGPRLVAHILNKSWELCTWNHFCWSTSIFGFINMMTHSLKEVHSCIRFRFMCSITLVKRTSLAPLNAYKKDKIN